MDLKELRRLAFTKEELAILTAFTWLTETRPEMGEMGEGFFASRPWKDIKDDSLLQAATLFFEFQAEFGDNNIDQECAYKQLNQKSK